MPGSEFPIFSVEELGLDKIQLFSPSSKPPFLICSLADGLSANTIPEKPILVLNTIAVENTPIPIFLNNFFISFGQVKIYFFILSIYIWINLPKNNFINKWFIGYFQLKVLQYIQGHVAQIERVKKAYQEGIVNY